jgi:uncharacterized protein
LTTLFFATDLHGSELCFKKFLKAAEFYRADLLFLGGDYSPKELLLYINTGDTIEVVSAVGKRTFFKDRVAFSNFNRWCAITGRLLKQVDGVVLRNHNADLYNQYYDKSLNDLLQQWAHLAERAFEKNGIPIFIIPGNDDPHFTDVLFERKPFNFVHRKHQHIDAGLNVLGWGGSNPTPWVTGRESSEAEIELQLREATNLNPSLTSTILFAHPPPFGSGLDLAPEIETTFEYKLSLGAPKMISVGSTAVRDFILDKSPLLGLFGHVHEGRGHQMIGSTLCVNPGSAFYSGKLLGCLVEIRNNKILDFQFTEG